MKEIQNISPGVSVTLGGKQIESKFTFGTLYRAQKKLNASNSQEIINRCASIDAVAIITLLIEGFPKDIRKGFKLEEVGDELPLSALKDISKAIGDAMGGEESEDGDSSRSGK